MPEPTEPNDTDWEETEYLLRPEPPQGARAGPHREESLRRVRRMSNWSVAALVAGAVATTAALAHQLPGHTSTVVYPTTTTGTSTAGTGTTSATGRGPVLSSPIVTSNGSVVVPAGQSLPGTTGSAAQTGGGTLYVPGDS